MNEAHEFAYAGHGDPHCAVCGASYHCGKCNKGCGMMGHQTQDDEGWFFHCVEPERYQRKRDADAFKREQLDRAHYEKLKAKFEP